MPRNDILKEEFHEVLKLIKSDKYKDSVKYLFTDYLTQVQLNKKINPKRYREYENERKKLIKENKDFRDRKKSANSNKTVKIFKVLKSYLDKKEGIKKFPYFWDRFMLKIDFYFDYADEQLKSFPGKNLPKVKRVINSTKKDLKLLERKRAYLRDKHKKIKRKLKISNTAYGTVMKLDKGEQKEVFDILIELTSLDKIISKNRNLIKHQEETIKDIKNLGKLSDLDKEILRFIFQDKKVRRFVCYYDDLIQGINKFLEAIFINPDLSSEDILAVDFIKNFYLTHKNYVDMKDYKSQEEQFNRFWHTIIETADNLRNKVKIILDFRFSGFLSLEFRDTLKKFEGISDTKKNDSPEEEAIKIRALGKEFKGELLPVHSSDSGF